MTRAELVAAVRSQTSEPVAGRFFETSEIQLWINQSLAELSLKIKSLKRSFSVLGSGYVAALGTSPMYFQAPANFMSVDRKRPILEDGLARRATTDAEVYQMQEWKHAEMDGVTGTIDVLEYFEVAFTGLKFHYTVDYINIDEKDAAPARSGKLIWFTPNPNQLSTLVIPYIGFEKELAGDTESPYLDELAFSDLIVTRACVKAARKMVVAGNCGIETVAMFQAAQNELLNDALRHFKEETKNPGRRRAKSAKQVYQMYNSTYYDGRRNT